jgi:hypothetical protein
MVDKVDNNYHVFISETVTKKAKRYSLVPIFSDESVSTPDSFTLTTSLSYFISFTRFFVPYPPSPPLMLT